MFSRKKIADGYRLYLYVPDGTGTADGLIATPLDPSVIGLWGLEMYVGNGLDVSHPVRRKGPRGAKSVTKRGDYHKLRNGVCTMHIHLSIRTILKLIYYWMIFSKATIVAIKNECRIERNQTVQHFQWTALAHFIWISQERMYELALFRISNNKSQAIVFALIGLKYTHRSVLKAVLMKFRLTHKISWDA